MKRRDFLKLFPAVAGIAAVPVLVNHHEIVGPVTHTIKDVAIPDTDYSITLDLQGMSLRDTWTNWITINNIEPGSHITVYDADTILCDDYVYTPTLAINCTSKEVRVVTRTPTEIYTYTQQV